MSTVQEALKAREERRKRELQESENKSQSKSNTVDSAFEAYKKRKQSYAQSSLSDIASRINAEIEAAKNVSSPTWGKGSLGTFLESTRENRLNVGKLKREVESYKSYLDEETYNSLFSTVSKLGEGYNSYIRNAEVMEKFATEDEFNAWKTEYDKIQGILSAEDFAEKSKYVSTYRGGEKFNAFAGMYTDTGFDDIMYDYINGNETAIGRQNLSDIFTNASLLGIDNSERREMEEQEIAIFNYLYATQGQEAAYEYIKSITSELNARQREAYENWYANYAKESPGMASVFSVITSPLKGLSYLGQTADYLADGKFDQNEGYNKFSYTNSAIRNEVSKNIEANWGGVGSFAYQTGMSMADFLFTTAVTGGNQVASLAIMGTSAAADTVIASKDLGLSDDQAFWLGTAAGAIEVATEKIGIDALFDTKVLKGSVGKYILKNLLAEGTEEGLSNVGNTVVELIDLALSGDESKIKREIYLIMQEQNIDESAAIGKYVTGKLTELGLDVLGGTISGGVMGGGGAIIGTAINSAKAKKIYGDNIQDLLIESAEIGGENAALVDKFTDKYGKKGTLSGYDINRLIESNENALVSQDKGKMKSAAEARLTELGETSDVGKLADIIVKSQLGEKLTSSEKKALTESAYGEWVAEELNPDSVNKGFSEDYSNWAESIGTERINAEAYNRAVSTYTGQTDVAEAEGVAESTKANAVTENALPKENAVESEISAPVAGVKSVAKAKMTDTEGNEVKPQRFATTDGGEMGVEIEDGKVVAASEVDFGESDLGLVRQAAVDMSSRVGGFSVDTANVFVNGYNEATGQSAGAYIDGWISAYKFGAMKNPPPLSALAANPKTSQLTEEQRKNAYNFGRAFGNEKIVNTVSNNAENISKTDSKEKKGRVIFDGAKYGKTLNERQRASLKALNFLSKALGKDIYIEKLGKGDNGWYNPADRSIHVDLYAGAEAEALMLFTVSHELTHDIRATLPEKFSALADAVFEEYTKRYDDHVMEDLIDAKIDFLKEKGDITEDMTEEAAYDLAYEEVICDCLETMLVDSDAIEALSKNIYAKDKGLWERIKDFFERIVSRIRAAYADVIPDSEEGQRFRDLGEGAERIKKLWVEAIVELSEVDKTTGEGKVKHSYSSIAYSFFGDKKVTIKDFENGSYTETEGYKKYVENCLNNMRQTIEGFNESEARQEIVNSIDGIVKVAVAMKKAGYDILDNHAKRSAVDSKNRLLFSSLEPNSDYFTSSDISTICDKRINFAEIYDEIVRREEAMGVPANKRFFSNVDNYFIIHDIMADKGLTQPCRECYVESMRKNLAPMANAFLELMQETDPDNKANKQLYQPSGKNKGELKSNNAKLRENLLKKIEDEKYDITVNNLTVEMLTTPRGLATLKLQAPFIYETFNSFYGQSKPKMPKEATPFRFGELTALLKDDNGKIRTGLIKQIMSTGGFRLQSYSDFQIQNFADVLQVIFEAGTLGLSGHAYTKVPAFLDATKGTNLKRNISIFMYNDGGEWKIDRNDSFPYALDEIYDIVKSDEQGNTSIIAVSQNEMMSAFIMANDNIGYFIPFHKSGMKMGTVRETIVKEGGREIKGYSGIKDHTRQQTEVWAKNTADHKANTKVNKGINIYEFWDFDNVDNLSREGLIEKNVKAYIDACEKAGYLPKFREYVMNNSKVLNAVLNYSKQLGFVSQNATIDDISFEYKGYRIPYGYYKCLGDFGMFTPDGEASPIERLSLKDYDFDEAEAFFSNAESLRRNEILQQIANGEKRERYRNSDMTTAEIAEEVQAKRNQVVEEVVSGEYKKAKHSHKASEKATYADSVYLDAVNRGDMETAQRMVDEAAKAAGYTVKAYHGTRKEFTMFDRSRSGENYKGWSKYGKGFYFAETTEDAEHWSAMAKGLGDMRTIPSYLRMENPFVLNPEEYETVEAMVGKMDNLADYVQSKGYDGIISPSQYVVFNPEQIKSADPVTYDDNGNVIPLSERFNPKNKDIRYQHRATNGMKPRTLLANALEGAVSEDERNLLQTYKDNIDKLNREQEKLDKVMSVIDEIRYKKSLSILGEEMSVKTFETRAKAKAEKNGINAEDVQFKLDRSNAKYIAYAVGHGTILEADKTFRSAEDNAKLNELWGEAKDISAQINTYDRELLKLQAMQPIKEVLKREKAQAVKRAEEKAEVRRKESVARVKESAAKTQRELMERYQESRKKATEGRNKTAMRHKIQKIARDLDSILNNGTKQRNVKNGERGIVRAALDLSEMLFATDDEIIVNGLAVELSDGEVKAISDYLKLYEEYHSYDDAVTENKARRAELRSLMTEVKREFADALEREKKRISKAKASAAFDALITEYKKLASAEEDHLKLAYKPEVVEYIEALKSGVGDTLVSEMTLEQLESVYKAFKMIKEMVTNSNKIWRQGKRESMEERRDAIFSELSRLKSHSKDHPELIGKALNRINEFSWNNLRPVDAFEMIGSDSLAELFWDVIDAQSVYAKDIEEVKDAIVKARQKYGYKKWDVNKTKSFEMPDGRTFTVTLGEMMSIYAYSKREQADAHMREGGFQHAKGAVYKDGKVMKLRSNKHLTYKVDDKLRLDIMNSLTKEQRDYATEMQTLLTSFGEKGNEASRILYGIDLFNEEVYFPLKSSHDYLDSVQTEIGQTATTASLAGSGMAKPTKPHANNPIILQAFDEVILEHFDRMSKYHAYVVVIDNLRKMLDAQGVDINENMISIKALIGEKLGDGARDYLQNYITDLNGSASISGAKNPLESFFGKAKGTSVAANLSVWVQQYFSVIRAFSEVNPRYFIPFMGEQHTKGDMKAYEEMKRYAPIATIKEMGGFDVGSNRGIKDYIGYEETGASKGKVAKKMQDAFGIGATLMDKLGWITIWKGIKKEVAASGKYKVGSEEYLKACGKRFEEVIVKTQVYDSVNARSGYMRSKHGTVKYLVSFMGEPTTIAGMAEVSIVKLKRAIASGDKETIKKATGSLVAVMSSIAVSTAMTSIVKSLVYAMRDDDEDETYLEKYAEALGGAFRDDINLLNYLPIARDIASVYEGRSIERPDMSLIEDLIDSYLKLRDSLGDEDATSEDKWSDGFKLAGAITNILGIPAKNIWRDLKGIVNTFVGIGKGYNSDVGKNFVEGWTGEKSKKGNDLYDAIVNGDTKQVEYYKSTYKDDTSYNTAVRKALRENDPRIKMAAECLNAGDLRRRDVILDTIVAEGHFDEKLVGDAIRAEANAIKEESEGDSADSSDDDKDEAYSIYQANDINVAFESGDTALAKEIIQDLIDTKVANGKTEKDAKSPLRSSMTSYWKPIYKKNPSHAEWSRIRKILYNSGLYGNLKEVDKTLEDWLKD